MCEKEAFPLKLALIARKDGNTIGCAKIHSA